MDFRVIRQLTISAGVGLLVTAFVSTAGIAAPNPQEAANLTDNPFGAYLAGRHAQEERDYGAAASWFEAALKTDQHSPELISRTFDMDAQAGRFEQARPLADQALKLDSSDAVAGLVLLVDRVKAGDWTAALARADALPDDGLHRYVGPLARAWTHMGLGNLAAADLALQDLDKFNGFAPLKYFQLGLLYEFAGKPDKAEAYFKQTLDTTGQLNWRLTDAMANFYQRRGRPDQAEAVYKRFIKENTGSELAEALLTAKPVRMPPPLVASATDGFAEALFDLASVVNQPETTDLALLYVRLRTRFEAAVCRWPATACGYSERSEQAAGEPCGPRQHPGKLALLVVGAVAHGRQSGDYRAHRRSGRRTPGDGGKGAQPDQCRNSARRPVTRPEALFRNRPTPTARRSGD